MLSSERPVPVQVPGNRAGNSRGAASLCLAGLVFFLPGVRLAAQENPGILVEEVNRKARELAEKAKPQDGDSVLSAALNAARLMQGIYVDIQCTSTLMLGGVDRQNFSRSRVWFRKPDRLVWATEGDLGSSVLGIDGQACTLYMPALRKYTVRPLVEDVERQVASMGAPYGVLVTACLSPDPLKYLEGSLAGKVEMRPAEYIGTRACYRIRVPLRNAEAEVWIAPHGKRALPVRVATTQYLPPAASRDRTALARTEVALSWVPDADLPDSTFVLNLPETAQKVETLGRPNLGSVASSALGKGKEPGRKGNKGKPLEPFVSDRKRINRELAYELPPEQAAGRGKVLEDGNIPSLESGKVEAPRPSVESVSRGGDNSGTPAPDFTLPLLDGGKLKLSSLRGKKAVVLDFWATWCGPCRQAMPEVAALAREWKKRGVEFYAVNMGEAAPAVSNFVRQNGLSIPVALDQDGSVGGKFGVSGIPHLVLIGKDGRIKAVHNGGGPGLRQSLEAGLQLAL